MIWTFLTAALVTLAASPIIAMAARRRRPDRARRSGGVPPAGARPLTPSDGAVPAPRRAPMPEFPAIRAVRPGDPDPPVRHEVPVDAADFVAAGFRPGIDRVGLTLNFADVDFDSYATDAGAVAEFRDGAECLRIVFPGVFRLPSGDIDLRFDHPRRGWQILPLLDLIGAGDAGAGGGTEHRQDATWRAAAWAEAERALETGWRAHATDADLSVLPEFHDFDAARECIEIWFPEGRDPLPALWLRPTDDGLDSVLYVGDTPTAILRGAPDADSRNLRLMQVQAEGVAA